MRDSIDELWIQTRIHDQFRMRHFGGTYTRNLRTLGCMRTFQTHRTTVLLSEMYIFYVKVATNCHINIHGNIETNLVFWETMPNVLLQQQTMPSRCSVNLTLRMNGY